ncbi:hypothetical protein OSL73_21170, partial [Escherichia coli]|nr:hypothetical protein [Escherichia coli]
MLTKDGQIFLNGTKIHLQGKEQVNGDSLLINWNCAASKSPPKTPDEKQDTPDIRLSPHLYLATNSAQGPWWILGGSERVPGAEDVLPAPLPPYRVLTGMA